MKFGILGEAKIAREWLVPAILDAGHEVTHIGRRNPGKEPLPSIYKGAIETDYKSLLSESSMMRFIIHSQITFMSPIPLKHFSQENMCSVKSLSHLLLKNYYN